MKSITVLGSTGSIGVSTLDVVQRHPDRFRVFALTANRSVARMLEQINTHQPEYAVMVQEQAAQELEKALPTASKTKVLAGTQALEHVVQQAEVDYVMAAIVGGAGLLPTLAAAHTGKRILLANKEALVMSGHLLLQALREHHAELLPIDSEHNAIFQCLPYSPGYEKLHDNELDPTVEKIILTGSGGPFRTTPIQELQRVTPDQACAHPNWDMGRKISVDSATMMNKGLELIEACYLFSTTTDHIQVVIHPQSIIHSMVRYIDGSVIAQLGNPDMRTPIAHALAWPERIDSGVAPLNLFDIAQLNFEQPDYQRFPCLVLAQNAMEQGPEATVYLNAANEIAVDAFLQEQIRFTDIAKIIEETLAQTQSTTLQSIDSILEADQTARRKARELVGKLTASTH